jgi:hypothetical protein
MASNLLVYAGLRQCQQFSAKSVVLWEVAFAAEAAPTEAWATERLEWLLAGISSKRTASSDAERAFEFVTTVLCISAFYHDSAAAQEEWTHKCTRGG